MTTVDEIESLHKTIMKLQLTDTRNVTTIAELQNMVTRYEKCFDEYRSQLEFKDRQLKQLRADIAALKGD